MIPILSLIHCILEQPLVSGDQSVQWGRDEDREDEGLGGFFQSGHLKNQASPEADTRAAKSSGGAFPGEASSVGHPSPTSRDRAQDPRSA